MKRLLPISLLLCLSFAAAAAINPEHYVNAASDHLQVREISRVVETTQVGDAQLRRVTLVGEVVDERDPTRQKVGRIIVIDYTVDLTERARAAKAHSDRMGNMPGPQFLGEPDPPKLDAEGKYWAHLAPSGERRGNVNRQAGAVVLQDGYEASGEVYVPVSAQYSFSSN